MALRVQKSYFGDCSVTYVFFALKLTEYYLVKYFQFPVRFIRLPYTYNLLKYKATVALT